MQLMNVGKNGLFDPKKIATAPRTSTEEIAKKVGLETDAFSIRPKFIQTGNKGNVFRLMEGAVRRFSLCATIAAFA